MERVLVQEVLTDGPGSLHLQPVTAGQGVHADQLDDLVQLCLLLQRLIMPGGSSSIRANILIKPFPDCIHIQRVAGQPVDRREMALIGQRGIQAPEYLDDTQRRLGDRLGNIAARRRYGADDGQRAHASVLAQGDDCPARS